MEMGHFDGYNVEIKRYSHSCFYKPFLFSSESLYSTKAVSLEGKMQLKNMSEETSLEELPVRFLYVTIEPIYLMTIWTKMFF